MGPAHLFSDVFQRTTGLGPSWSVRYGSFATDGTSAVSGTPPANGNWARVVTGLGAPDYSVAARVTIPANSQYSGLVARSSDPANFDSTLYAAQLSTDGTVALFRRNAWTWAKLASMPAGVVANTTYSLALAVSGNSPVHLEVWLDQRQVITADDASPSRITSGAAGLENYAAGVKYGSFTIDPTLPHVFSDYFARTTGLGAGWQLGQGSFSTDGTNAISGAPPIGGNWAAVAGDLGGNDYSVSADIVIPSGALYSGLVARSSDPAYFDDNLYSAQISADGSVNLYRRNDWSWTSLGSTAAGVVPNQRYGLKLVVTGASPVHLEVWLDGVMKVMADDSSSSRIAAGRAGIENYDAG